MKFWAFDWKKFTRYVKEGEDDCCFFGYPPPSTYRTQYTYLIFNAIFLSHEYCVGLGRNS